MPNRGTIILYVSKGPNLVTMPDIVGKTLEEATEELFKAEIEFETFEQYDAKVKPGAVIRTLPEAGEEFDPKKTPVYVFVMPDQQVIESSSQPADTPDEESEGGEDWGIEIPFFHY
jgi:serine/threonine-protein kinase